MKRIVVICLLILSVFQFSHAQLANGSLAPDIVATDVNGVTWHLYDILDQGKSVVLDFSATWCGICWNYHNTNILNSLQSSYGSTGTNAIQVLFLEADLNTNTNCLYGSSGCVGGTQGNWVGSSNYPIANLANNYTQIAYGLNGYPTLYGISPDRRAYYVGAASKSVWETWLLQSFKMALSGTVTDVGCQNLGAIDLSVTSGYGNKTYAWSNGATTQDISGLSAGTYTVVVTDANGYAKTQSFTVASSGVPQSAASSSGNIDCSHAQVTVSGTGSSVGNNISYLWTTANGNILSGANTINALVNAAGTYSLKVTNNTSACTSTAIVQVMQVSNGPIANAGSPQTITCTIPQVTLNGTASAGSTITYLWSTPTGNIVSGNNTLTPVVNAAGIYNLLVTNTSNGCTASSSVLIPADNAHPIITVTNGNLSCTLPTTQICATVTSGVSVSWNINGTNVAGNCATVSSAGTYQATALAANGCTTTAASTVAAAPNLPQISIASPPLLTCTNTTATLLGTLVGVLADYTISWTTTNGNIVSGANTLTPVVNKAGQYKMNALNNNTNCQTAVETTVTQFINTPIALFSTSLVNGQLTLIGSNPNGNVSWALGNGNVAGGASVTVTYPASGTYNICMTVTNECDQTVTCKPIAYLTPMALTATVSNPVCHGGKGSIAANAVGGPTTGTIAYQWNGPNGFTANTAQLSNLSAGIYNGTITDAVGLIATNAFTIAEPTLIVATPNITHATNGQANGAISVGVVGGSGFYDVMWSNGGSGGSIMNLSPGSYTAKVKDTYGCEKTVGPYVVQMINAAIEIDKDIHFTIYPNPVYDRLQYTISSGTQGEVGMEVVNTLNQSMWKSKVSADATSGFIDTSDLPNGLYLLQIKNAKMLHAKSFLVQHH